MLAVLLLGCCLLVGLLWQLRGRSSRDQRPPVYPGALPVIGHAHLLINKDNFFNMLKSITEYTREKQCDSVILKVGPFATYVLTDPDDCLAVSNMCLKKSFIYKFLDRVSGLGLFTSDLELWKRQRKAVNSTLNSGMLNEFMTTFNYKAKRLLDDIVPHEGKGQFNPDQILTELVFEAASCTILNIKVDEIINKSFIYVFKDLCKVYWERFRKFWLLNDTIYNWSSLRKKEDKLNESYMDTVKKPLFKRKSELFPNNNNEVSMEKVNEVNEGKVNEADINDLDDRSLIDVLLHLQHTKNALTDEEIVHNLITILFASYDTTSNSLLYILLAVGTYERVQQRIYEELQEVFGGTSRDVDKHDLSKLVYLEAVIKETLRLYPVGAYVARTTDTDVKLKQCTLPAGSDIVLLNYAVNRHPVWGPDADEFRPERWLEQGGAGINPNAFAAFSVGKRACIGKQYAMMIMKVILAHFLRQYRVAGDINKLQLQFDNIIMGPKSGHEITVESRV